MNLEQQVFQKISELTGIESGIIRRDLNFEADLGLDSIKLIGLFNNLTSLLTPDQSSGLEQRMTPDTIAGMRTIGDVIAFLEGTPSTAATLAIADTHDAGAHPQAAAVKDKDERVPILDAQYLLLASHYLFNSNSLCSTVRLEGPFDLNLAQHCWQALIEHHPILRTYFRVPDEAVSFKDYQCLALQQPVAPEIACEDIRALDRDAKERMVSDTFESFLNHEWQLMQWPLHRFIALRLEDEQYQLFLANEHVISDGLGNQMILRDFLELYQAAASGQKPDLPATVTTQEYRQVVEKMNAYHNTEEKHALDAYIRQQGNNTYFWNPGKKDPTAPIARMKNLAYRLDRSMTAQLIARTRNLRFPLNSLIAGAYLRTVGRYDDGRAPLILQIPTSGRVYPDVDASAIVGCFAQNLALGFSNPAPDEDLHHYIGHVHHEIQQALVAGYDRAQTRELSRMLKDDVRLQNGKLPEYTKSMMRAGIKSNLYFPYTGHTGIKPHYGPLAVVDYRAGTVNAAGTLDVLQELFDDRLHVFANYDAHFFSEALIKQIIESYMGQLKELAGSPKPQIQGVAATTPLQAVKQPPINADVIDLLCRISAEVCRKQFTPDQAGLDMEAELGVDSLERIRIIAKIKNALDHRVDRNALFGCRSIDEMAAVIGGSDTVARTDRRLPGNQNSHTGTVDADAPIESEGLGIDTRLPEIPLAHIIRQAALTPEAVAVTGNGQSLTYGQLDSLSNRLANYLLAKGIGPGRRVGIMTLRGPNMLTGMLGILKAGAAYVPVDPDYPAGRVAYILSHAEVDILISESPLAAQLSASLSQDVPVKSLLFIDEWTPLIPSVSTDDRKQIARQIWIKCSDTAPEFRSSPDDLMVVLYTSGSTGQPKGVALNHRGYMNRLLWHQKVFRLQPGERVVQKTSCCFDISVWELFWPLMVGGVVCAADPDTVRNPWKQAAWMRENRINIMHFVPSMFGEFVRALEGEEERFPDLRWLIFSGEALPGPFLQEWIDKHGMDTGLANLYGPTEASIDVTYHIVDRRPKDDERIPIGKPIDHVHILILDENRRPMPPGELGELYICGVQLAQGYLKDPERTAQAFVENPFNHIPGKYIYRSGDLACELPDGSFDYHGRIDNQIKIRGFRVEPGEIESALNAHSAIDESGVLAVEVGDRKKLVAWLAGEKIADREVKTFVGRHLPDYMIPHHIVWEKRLPKTHNGKLDRKALLADFNPAAGPTEALPGPTAGPQHFALGPAQRWLVSYFDSPYLWWGYTRFVYKQPLDPAAFAEACNHLLRQHAALRAVFEKADGDWRQHTLPTDITVEPELFDASQLDPQQQDAEIRRMIPAIGETLKIDTFPLWRVVIVRLSETAYDITMICHHLVSDLIAGNLLFSQLWQTYHRLLSGDEAVTEQPSDASYEAFVRYLQDLDRQGRLEPHVAYWKSSFPDEQHRFEFPADHRKGENIESAAALESFSLSNQESRILLSDAKAAFDGSLYALLLTPLYRLMANWTGRSGVVISHKMNGRDLGEMHPAYFDTVGNFAINCPVALDVDPSASWVDSLRQFEAALDNLPMKGATYDWIADRLPSYMYPDDKLTPIRVNYLGNLTLPPSEIFEIKQEQRNQRLAPPEQKRTILIEIHVFIVEGSLHVEMTYSQNHYRAATIRKLGAGYMSLLRDMLASIPTDPLATADPPPTPAPPVSPQEVARPHASAATDPAAASSEEITPPAKGGRSLISLNLVALYIISFLSGFSMGIFNPLIALFMEEKDVAEIWIGTNSTFYYLVIAVGALVVGKLISRFGIRSIMLVGLLLTGAIAPVFPLTTDLTVWFAIRGVMGFGVCLYMIGGQTALNAYAPESKRALTTALHAAAFGIGFGISPVIGTQAYVRYPEMAFILGGTMILSGLFVTGFMLTDARIAAPAKMSKRLFSKISVPLHAVFAYGAFEGILVSLFPIYLAHQRFSVQEIGFCVTLFVLGTGLGMLPVSFLGDRWGRIRVLFVISLVGLCAVIAVTAIDHRMLIFISSGILGATIGPIFPLALAIIGGHLTNAELPSGSALFTSYFSYGCAAGPILSAFLMDHLGDQFIFMLINILLALLLLRILFRAKAPERTLSPA